MAKRRANRKKVELIDLSEEVVDLASNLLGI